MKKLRHYYSSYLEGLKKTSKYSCQDSQYLSQGSQKQFFTNHYSHAAAQAIHTKSIHIMVFGQREDSPQNKILKNVN
jgi:hypothetical protein